jgi:hypothetical protein
MNASQTLRYIEKHTMVDVHRAATDRYILAGPAAGLWGGWPW